MSIFPLRRIHALDVFSKYSSLQSIHISYNYKNIYTKSKCPKLAQKLFNEMIQICVHTKEKNIKPNSIKYRTLNNAYI